MSHRLMDLVPGLAIKKRYLPLMYALAAHASDDGERIYPSIATLARESHQTPRSVQYELRDLERDGWIASVSELNRPGSPIVYRINLAMWEYTGRQAALPSDRRAEYLRAVPIRPDVADDDDDEMQRPYADAERQAR